MRANAVIKREKTRELNYMKKILAAFRGEDRHWDMDMAILIRRREADLKGGAA